MRITIRDHRASPPAALPSPRSAAPRRGQAARRRVDRDARRSHAPGRRRSRRRHVAVARLPGSALRRGQAVAGAGPQPRRRAGLRRAATWRSAGCRRWCSSRATRASSAASRATSTPRRRFAPRTSPNVPSDQLRAMGDIHPLGNPHYWIPPENARAIARLLAARFTALDAARRGHVSGASWRRSRRAWSAKEKEWEAAAAPLRGTNIVTYHKSWSYVARWLGLEEIGYHRAQARHPTDGEPHRPARRADEEVGRQAWSSSNRSTRARWRASSPTTAAPAWSARPSNVGATPAIKTYFDLVDAVVAALEAGDRHTARASASDVRRRRRRRAAGRCCTR